MITKEIAASKPRELWHLWVKNSDGSPMRCRSNGAVKTWKTAPDAWMLPCKYGLRETFRIGTRDVSQTADRFSNPAFWCTPELHAAERELFRDLIPDDAK